MGGLIIKSKKKSEDKSSDSIFKKPSGSLLGLDVLAKRKREQRQADEEISKTFVEKKACVRQNDDDDSDIRISFGRSDVNKDRHYRGSHVETPSHPGGVSDEALEKFHQHIRKGELYMKIDRNYACTCTCRSSRNFVQIMISAQYLTPVLCFSWNSDEGSVAKLNLTTVFVFTLHIYMYKVVKRSWE